MKVQRKAIRPNRAPAPSGAYSPGLLVDNWLFVSGQGPGGPSEEDRVGDSIEEQTEQALKNVEAILQAAGGSLVDVVSSTVHLSDISMFDRFNAVYERHFPDPKPARTTVGSSLTGGILVEVAVIARVSH